MPSITASIRRVAIPALAAVALSSTLTACVVAPVGPGPYAYSAPAPATVYVAPTYVSPGVGWVWAYHPRYGWGYHHPSRGWHRGWR